MSIVPALALYGAFPVHQRRVSALSPTIFARSTALALALWAAVAMAFPGVAVAKLNVAPWAVRAGMPFENAMWMCAPVVPQEC